PAVPGAEIGYKILIANNSPNTATGSFELDVSVPRFVDVNFQGGAYCAGPVSGCRFGDVLQYTVASIAAGASTLLQFNVAVDNSVTYPPPPDGTILFADASASVFGAVSATSTILVNSTSHLNLTVSSVPSRVAPGATLTYTLNAANVGTGSVPVVLSSAVPKGTSFVSATGGGTSSAGLVEWSFASLASGAIQQRQMVVTVDADAAPGFLLVAPVQLLQPTTRRTLAREQATNLVANDALLSVAMSATPTTVAPGGTVVYTLSVNNNSANTPTGSFSLNVNVPRFVSITQQGGAYCAGGIGGCRFGDILQYTVPSIAAAGGTTLSFSAVVDNTVTSPAPASGTVLTASAFAYQFGGVQASAAVFVGSTPTLSGGETSAGGSGGGGGASASGGDTSTAGNSAAGGNSSLGGANANGGDNAGIGDLAGAGGDLLSGEAGEAGSTGGSHPAGGGNAANGGSDTSTDTAGGSGASSSGKGDSKSGGCSVSVGGQSTTTRGGWLFALLGLAYVGRMQRRRRASALLNRD
ncbi:MAG TPA: MYXO-CTERM sorting domain-containing protein, partial [Polyangiaceae bacterium]